MNKSLRPQTSLENSTESFPTVCLCKPPQRHGALPTKTTPTPKALPAVTWMTLSTVLPRGLKVQDGPWVPWRLKSLWAFLTEAFVLWKWITVYCWCFTELTWVKEIKGSRRLFGSVLRITFMFVIWSTYLFSQTTRKSTYRKHHMCYPVCWNNCVNKQLFTRRQIWEYTNIFLTRSWHTLHLILFSAYIRTIDVIHRYGWAINP